MLYLNKNSTFLQITNLNFYPLYFDTPRSCSFINDFLHEMTDHFSFRENFCQSLCGSDQLVLVFRYTIFSYIIFTCMHVGSLPLFQERFSNWWPQASWWSVGRPPHYTPLLEDWIPAKKIRDHVVILYLERVFYLLVPMLFVTLLTL